MSNVQNTTNPSPVKETKPEVTQQTTNAQIELLKSCIGSIKSTITTFKNSHTNKSDKESTINSQVSQEKINQSENVLKISAEKMEKYRDALRLLKCQQNLESMEVVGTLQKAKAKDKANKNAVDTTDTINETTSKEKNGDQVTNESLSRKYLAKASASLGFKSVEKKSGRYTFQEI